MKEKLGRELLFSVTKKDLNISFFSGTGGGGQHRNKHQNCVRMYHPDSGASVTGQSFKERPANIKEALRNLLKHPKFRIWHNKMVQDSLSEKSIEEKVEEMMNEKNLKVEVKEDGKWIEENIV